MTKPEILRAIVPAAPGCFLLYYDHDEEREVIVPVVAWAVERIEVPDQERPRLDAVPVGPFYRELEGACYAVAYFSDTGFMREAVRDNYGVCYESPWDFFNSLKTRREKKTA